jgi:hypothetical protein
MYVRMCPEDVKSSWPTCRHRSGWVLVAMVLYAHAYGVQICAYGRPKGFRSSCSHLRGTCDVPVAVTEQPMLIHEQPML